MTRHLGELAVRFGCALQGDPDAARRRTSRRCERADAARR